MLILLIAGGAILACCGIAVAALCLLRIRRRLEALQQSPLAVSLRGLQLEGERLSNLSGSAAPLAARAKDAIESLSASTDQLHMPQAAQAMQQAGGEIRALIDDLR